MIDVDAMVEAVAQEKHPEFWVTGSETGQAAARDEARGYVTSVLSLLPTARIEWSLKSEYYYPGKWPTFVTQEEAQRLAIGNPVRVVKRAVTDWVVLNTPEIV